MRKLTLLLLFFVTLYTYGQEGTKQLMPTAGDKLYLEFGVFANNNFGLYNSGEKERINIYMHAGEKMYYGMTINTEGYSSDVYTNYRYRSFRILDPNGVEVHEQVMTSSGNDGYIDNYSEAINGPNGAILNGTPISGGYQPLVYEATSTGNHYIEFSSWLYPFDTNGSDPPNEIRRRRFALQYFDVTVTDAFNNVITNPGEPNRSAGRLWSYAWQLCNTSFDQYPVNAHFYVVTEDRLINKVNFEMTTFSFVFLANHFGITPNSEEPNYVKRTQSMEGDEISGEDIAEYPVFFNDPDRTVWPNILLTPPKVKVWAEEELFMDYDYNRDPLYLDLQIDSVILEKNREFDCPYEDVTFFKIESSLDGYTVILLDIDGDGEYSPTGSDRVIYRELKRGLNYILWDFKTDAVGGAVVADGKYNASATFLGRGPSHFPLYDVEELSGITTSAVRPFEKLNTTIYWDDTQITNWGDNTGTGLMDDTEKKQLRVEVDIPRTWSWAGNADDDNNGNLNTMNSWFNAIDLGYSSFDVVVQQSLTKCIDGSAPFVGDVYFEGDVDQDIIFDVTDLDYKFFQATDAPLSSIEIVSLPAEGTLYYDGNPATAGLNVNRADIDLIKYTPPAGYHGKDSLIWKATASNGIESNNQENIYFIINTKPTISPIDDQKLCTNTPTAPIAFTVNDAETDPADLVVTGFSANPGFVPHSGIHIEGTGTNRTVTVTPVANQSGRAIIYVMVDDGLSQVIEEFAVTVSPSLEFNGDTIVCEGDDLYLIAEEVGATYSWKYEGTEVATSRILEQIAPVSIGEWSLTVTKTVEGETCTSSRYFNVIVAPITTFSGDQDVCTGETIDLTATETNAVYEWTHVPSGDTYSGRNLTIDNASSANAGNYTLYVSKYGCSNTSEPFAVTVINAANTGNVISGNTIDPGHDNGQLVINNAESGILYNVYHISDTTVSIASGSGLGTITIDIADTHLSLGNNIFRVGADNGNCEVMLSDTANIFVRTPGITVSAISGNTSENETTASFTVYLNTQPTADVTINLSSSDASEGVINSPVSVSLTFTAANYSTAQTVTVQGVDDDIIDGDINYTIITNAVSSSDIYYNGLNADDVDLVNLDDDVAGVSVDPVSGLTTSEAGGTAQFNVVLDCQPNAEVTITLSSSNTDEGLVTGVSRGTFDSGANTASISFDASNWNSAVVVTVTGQNDDIDDTDQTYYINTSLTTSPGDLNFNGLLVDDVEISNSDDDIAGVTVSPTAGLVTSEDGDDDTFTIVLDSEPTSNVTIALSSSDETEGTVSPANVVFTPLNWNTPQTVTATGVNDPIDDGDIPYTIITAAAASLDGTYNGINPADVSVTNTDNDEASLIVAPLTGLVTTETGGEASFTVKLQTQPVNPITISVISNNTDEGTVDKSSLTFNSTNWNTNQTVTIAGVDDDLVDGDIGYTITLSVTSGDTPYTSLDDIDISVTNNDDDVAGVTVSPTEINTSETGAFATFSLVLTSEPKHDVTISFSGVDNTEGSIDKSSVTFTLANWNTPQDVTITGLDDALADGDVQYTITTTASSSDSDYNNIAIDDVQVTNADNDIAGITVLPTSGLQTSESGGYAEYTIVLNTQPTADVTINISSSDTGEGAVDKSSVTFTAGNWSTAQTVRVTGVDDDIDDGNINYTIVHADAVSSDPVYDGMPVNNVSVTNLDDDNAGISVSAISGNTTEGGGTATFNVVLDTEPTANVTISFVSTDLVEGTISPASYTFTAGNWDSHQTVTVTGKDDDIDDGDQTYDINISVSSADGNYGSAMNTSVEVINEDNDNAGITVSAISGNTTEGGGTATFTVVLNTEPIADVIISFSSTNVLEGTFTPASYTFTSANWNTAQTVTVTGQDDDVDDGDQTYNINVSLSSADGNYGSVMNTSVAVINEDDDVAGVSISPTSGLETTEDGGTATFTVVLDTRPTATVTVNFVSSDTGEGTLSPENVSFTTSNWNSPRTITITGVPDDIDDGDIAYTIVSSVTTGSDAVYNAIDPADVAVTNIDNDNAGITVTAISGNTTESGGTATFTVVLDSEPTDDVVISFSSSNTLEGTALPASYTFTSANWNSAQTVTVTGQDDDIDDGDQTYYINLGVSSPDGNYGSTLNTSVEVLNEDDDLVGIIVNPTAGLYTKEDGTTASFNVRLNSEPTANVTFNLYSDNEDEGIPDVSSLTFTPGNWNVNQTVTVAGQDDDIADTDIAYFIITEPAVSSDPLYNNINPANVSLTNQDDDLAGIIVSPQNLTINETGADQTFTIVLRSEPTHNVSINLSSDNTDKGTIDKASITFIPAEWNVAQTITVSPVDNDIDDGDITFNIITAAAISDDNNYKNRNAADVAVTSINNDVADIIVSAISNNTSEDGTTATFTIVLNSEPTDDVSIDIESDNTAEGTVSHANVTFTSIDWNIPVEITVTGVDDATADGTQTYHIVIDPAVSSDLNYDGMDADDITLVNADDDSPGITVFPINGLVTTEAGGTATFNVRLNSLPTHDVLINLSSSNENEGVIDKSSLTFTTADWSTNQLVTVTGVDDDIDDGDQPYTIELSSPQSADNGYDTIGVVQNVLVTNRDDSGPRLNDDSATTDEETEINIDVLDNDNGLDNGGLALTISTQPVHGSVTVESDNSITYIPNKLYNGIETFEYRVCDAESACDVATVTIEVTKINDFPVAMGDNRATSINTDASIDVLFNDYGLEDGGITISIIEGPEVSEGTAVVSGENIIFTPALDYLGLVKFIYQVEDIDGDSDTAYVAVNIHTVNHQPDAVNDYVETYINTSVNISVLANDTGFEDGFDTLKIHSNPAHGSVIVNTNRTITYTPDADFTGSDSFIYHVQDVDGDYDTATVSINVIPVGDSQPVAVNDARATDYETPVYVDVLVNDSGLDDAPLALNITTAPINGIAQVIGDSIRYTPDLGFSGTETFRYQVCDDDGDCSNNATVTITVLEDGEINHIPVALNDTVETTVNMPVSIYVLDNDTILDGFGKLKIQTQAAFGSVVINDNRSITYTPSNLFVGDDRFEYWLEDTHGDYAIATVFISVKETPNATPVAFNDARATEYQSPVYVDVLANDKGLEDGGITLKIVTSPGEGTAEVSGDSILYTPANGFSGISVFEYSVSDMDGDSDTAQVTITVLKEGVTNHIPVAVNDVIETIINTPVDIHVLSNDTLHDGFGELKIYTEPASGSVLVNENRTITYTPSNLFIGDDSFEYWVEDIHGDYDIASVSVRVVETPNYKPVANNDARGTEYQTPVYVDVLRNDTGLEDGGITLKIVTGPGEGTANVSGDSILYTPANGFSGLSVFEYSVTDVDGDSDTAQVTITVLEEGVINHIPVAVDDYANTYVNAPVDINVLANDTILDGFGDLKIFSDVSHGTLIVNENRTITYTPNNLFIGNDHFEYWVEDVDGDYDYDIASVYITVTEAPNYLPVANDDARGTEYQTPVYVDVLRNDTGLEDGGITLQIVTDPAEGAALVTGDSILYTPVDGFSGISVFEYSVSDINGDSDTAQVTITVLGEGVINHIPVTVNDAAETTVNNAVNINVLANDTILDGFGDLKIHAEPDFGSVIVNANRTITYTPSNLFIGDESFEYWLEDVHGDYDIATVTVRVSDTPNAIPVANDDARATEYETPVYVDVLINDIGLEDGGIVLDIISLPDEGTASVTGDSILYTPADGYSGTTSLRYQVCDKDGDCSNIATLTITVLENGVTNHIPVAVDDFVETGINTATNIIVLANDTVLDGFGDLKIHTQPNFGTVLVNANRTITYTPSNLFVGDDRFEYWIEDIHGDYAIATVFISVIETPNVVPVATDDARATEYETPVYVDVLVNDSGLNDGGITLQIITNPSEGLAVVSGDSVLYTPADGFSGISVFEYSVTDIDGDSDTATVTITVLEEGVVNHVPVAVDDTAQTIINTAVTINVLANDTIVDGFGKLKIQSEPAYGSVVVNANRTLTYTPSNLFFGSDYFEYWVEDIHGDYDIATVTVNVIETPNSVPLANDDARGTEYESLVSIDVLTNDSGLDDKPIIISIESEPAQGTAVVNGEMIDFEPAPGFSGVMNFQYRITDKDGEWSVAKVTITVKAEGVVNYIPVANDDTAETYENTTVEINVLGNDSGLDDGFGKLIIFNAPANGNVEINPNRTISYTPTNWFIGTDEFTYWLEDVDGDYDTATVRVSVTKEGNHLPVANDDACATEFETPVSINVLENDEGLEDLPMLVEILSPPAVSEGLASVISGTNEILFTPAVGYSGSSSFEYTVTDADGDSDNARVTITVLEEGIVNHIPVAVDDHVTTTVNTSVHVSVLDNDAGLEDGFGNLLIHSLPLYGEVVVNSNRTITYTPANMFVGSDEFEYWIEDVHGDHDIAKVMVTVTDEPNYVPVANNDRRGTSLNTAVTVDVLVNDTGLEDGGIILTINSNPDPSEGSVVVNADNTITFTPATDYVGESTFSYQVEDADGDSDIADVIITVKSGINSNPDAMDDYITTKMNETINHNILSNDLNLDDGIGQVIIFEEPEFGSVTVHENYTVSYTPSNWFVGEDQFKYWIEDMDGDYDTATVFVSVLDYTNNIPVANDDYRGTSINTSVDVDVLFNDTGLEDGGIIISIETNPQNGTLQINADNTITYTPDNNYLGTDEFVYRVCDKDNDCDIATVTITVRETNAVPLAVDDKFYVNVNETVVLDVLDNDSGLEDGGINVQILTDILIGNIIVNSDNTLSYTPLTGYEGIEYFAYLVSDVDGDYDIAMVTIQISSGTLPGVIISEITGNTSEDGTTASFDVVLNNQPTTSVHLDLYSSDLTEGIISENRLTFTTENWNVAQSVVVTGVDDDVDDGDISYIIQFDNAISTDLSYNALNVPSVQVINIDNDEAGIYVNANSYETNENGTSAIIRAVLNSKPLENVSLEIESSDLSEGTLDKVDVLFTHENWSDTVMITVTGVDDNEVDGDISYSISFSNSESIDPLYNAIVLDDIHLVNIDNDSKTLRIGEAFSPGKKDGLNDYFVIENLQHHNRAKLRVYNRWGSLVYSSDNYKNNWDGKSNRGSSVGSELPTGTYFYILEIEGKSEKINGSVFIKR